MLKQIEYVKLFWLLVTVILFCSCMNKKIKGNEKINLGRIKSSYPLCMADISELGFVDHTVYFGWPPNWYIYPFNHLVNAKVFENLDCGITPPL